MTPPLRVSIPGSNPYDVRFVTADANEVARQVVVEMSGGRPYLFTDHRVGRFHGEALGGALANLAGACPVFEMDEGETAKSLETASRGWDFLLRHRLQRGDYVVALGGGVVGDVAGFVASTVLRGVRVVQVATSVVAMADSAIGGKTGIDSAWGKNLIGTFHQPSLVLAWVNSLETLDERHYRSGLAEVVKSALLAGEETFASVESSADALVAREPSAVVAALRMASSVKAAIVEADPLERGDRARLNLGHTLGHALEVLGGYTRWLHGEAVAIGIVAEMEFMTTRDACERSRVDRARALLTRLGLPVLLPGFEPERWREAMGNDKKRERDQIKLVGFAKSGTTRLDYAMFEDVLRWLEIQPPTEGDGSNRRT